MPRRPPSPCPVPGCRALTSGGRCAEHATDAMRARRAAADARRTHAADRGYDAAWRRLRAEILRGEPLCRVCRRAGRDVPAEVVDHIVPMAAGGERLDPANLQPLCARCHNVKTAREDGAFGRPRSR